MKLLREVGRALVTSAPNRLHRGRRIAGLARYIMRPPISLGRLEWDGAGEVRSLPKAGHDSGTQHRADPAETIDAAEFLPRLIMHVPEPRRHLVLCYGAQSKASRARRKRLRYNVRHNK